MRTPSLSELAAFKDLSPDAQKAYLAAHPNSKLKGGHHPVDFHGYAKKYLDHKKKEEFHNSAEANAMRRHETFMQEDDGHDKRAEHHDTQSKLHKDAKKSIMTHVLSKHPKIGPAHKAFSDHKKTYGQAQKDGKESEYWAKYHKHKNTFEKHLSDVAEKK